MINALIALATAVAAVLNGSVPTEPADEVCIGISALPAGATEPVGVDEWCLPATR